MTEKETSLRKVAEYPRYKPNNPFFLNRANATCEADRRDDTDSTDSIEDDCNSVGARVNLGDEKREENEEGVLSEAGKGRVSVPK